MTNISNLGLQQLLTSGLLQQQTTMSQLSEQLSSGQQYSNLTDYSPTDAHNILDFQSAITQRQSYLSSMQNVSTRLSVYDSSMTDIESMAAQANTLATQNQAYSATNAANIQQSAIDYMKQLTDDLNQQVGGRYVYAGARYNTVPVTDLTTLTNAPTTTTTTSPALPSYDTQFNNATSFTVNSTTPSGSFTIGTGSSAVSIPWSQVEAGHVTSVSLGGASTTLNPPNSPINLPNIPASTPSQIAANMAYAISHVAADTTDVPSSYGISSLTASSSGANVTLNFNGSAPLSVTPDAGGAASETTWVGGSTPNGTVAQTPNSSAAAYSLDQATVDTNYAITYGVSSNDPSFQKLVNGLRFINSAVTAGQGGDTATYTSDMQKASTLIGSALSGIQTLHAQVASNQNTISTQTTTQNTDITNLQNQLSNIQQVNLTQVGTELSLLQTQLQASYSSTASLEKLSLLTYL